MQSCKVVSHSDIASTCHVDCGSCFPWRAAKGEDLSDRLEKGHVSIGWCTDRLGVPLGLSDGGRSTSLIMSLWENDLSLAIAT